ncbi:GTPase-activating protein CdGAPr, partial [Orchesella cincta]
SGIWEASEVETSKGSIRIQHLTAVATNLRSVTSGSGAASISGGQANNPRFPKLEDCAHFHYDYVELPVLKILIREDTSKSITLPVDDIPDKCAFAIEVSAGGQSWVIRRTHANFILLDEQLHRCVWDRSFSRLEPLKERLAVGSSSNSSRGRRQISCANNTPAVASSSRRRTTSSSNGEDLVVLADDADQDNNSQQQQHSDHPDEEHSECKDTIVRYLSRLAQLPTNKITCGTVLSWLELDNRGRHIVSSDDSDINTPAVAAACATRKYLAQAADEIAFEVGDMISVIDMPEKSESIWWRGKRGFHVGFFPRECVQVIGDKVPAGLPIVSSVRRLQRLSVSSSASSSAPEKPVLRKHGKLIAFFRSFILSRPSRRRLKQSGILRERVFSCDLAEHLLNTGNDIPAVLKCCAEFIEKRGIVDGIYRLSGITSNIQKLRNLFDEDKIPNLDDDIAIKQDIHAVSSLLKMYFRELPNPLCTYQLYDKFVTAAQASDEERLFRMREVVQELPPPHYRTLEYLMKHLARVAQRSNETGMTCKNMAIVWAPNLIRCKELEAGGVDALKGIGVQAVVTEYLVRHADLIFNDKLPANYSITTTVLSHKASCSASGRPKSLAISSPIRLMSLEEAQDRVKQDDRKYVEVGGGPASLPPKYHTVIDLPSRRSALKNKRSPIGWRQFFSRNRSFSKPTRKTSNPIEITVVTKSMPMAGPQGMQSNWVGRLRPVKSVESLVSSPMFTTNNDTSSGNHLDPESVLEDAESSLSKSSPATPIMTDVDVLFHAAPSTSDSSRSIQNPKTHNRCGGYFHFVIHPLGFHGEENTDVVSFMNSRSISHDSYFEFGEFRNSNRVYIDETLEEETLSQSSKLSLEISSGGESPTRKSISGKKSERRHGLMSPVTPPPSAASLVVPAMSESVTSTVSTSSEDVVSPEDYSTPKSPLLRSKWKDSEVQTSQTKLYDVGVCTQDDMEHCAISYTNTTTVNTLTVNSSAQQTRHKMGSEQSLISRDDSGEPVYELDRNSSVDESSVDSTPCEPFATTNIIYSPLVDDLSSPASSVDHFRFPPGSDPFRVSSDSEASSTNNTNNSTHNQSKKSSALYISPLYEAGVTTMESISSTSPTASVTAPTEVTDVSSNSSPRVSQYVNVSIIKSHNFGVFLCSSASSQSLDAMQQNSSIAGHVYENHRVYENQPPPVPAIRKSKSEGAVLARLALATQLQSQSIENVSLAVTNVCVQPEPVYDKEHYENVSEVEVKPADDEEAPQSHENNIYEDIDDDDDEDVDDLHTNNKYETVDFEKGDMNDVDNESEGVYEKVRVQKSEDEYNPVVIHHHYAEIEERSEKVVKSPELNTQTTTTLVIGSQEPSGERGATLIRTASEESSPSHSHTEDMVTYLEVQTPQLNLRTNSLEDQASETSGSQPSSGYHNKLNNSNSLNSDTPNSPGDEGEIRHIDSPVAIDNPLYGVQDEEIVVETKDLDLGAMSDGENDMSANESLSISISMEETPSSNNKLPKGSQNTSQESQESDNRMVRIDKLVSRCNSAPLAVGVHEFTVALNGTQGNSLDGSEFSTDGAGGDSGNDEVFLKTKSVNKSSVAKDEMEKRFGEKVLLCKRLSEPSLLFSNISPQKTDSDDRSNNSNSLNMCNNAAWRIADAKRLANRKQSVKELLSRFESRDSNTSPVSSPVNSGGASLPPTGLSKNDIASNKDSQENGSGTWSSTGRSGSNNSSGRFQHHRFSMGDILMSQSVSVVENLSSIPLNIGTNIVRSDTYPELSRDDSATKENALDDVFSSDKCNDEQGTDKSQQALRVVMSSVDMNDPSRRERIEKYKEERRSFLRQKINSELTSQKPGDNNMSMSPKSPDNLSLQSLDSPVDHPSKGKCGSITPESSESNSMGSLNRSLESPRKRAFSEEDCPLGSGSNTTKSIKTDPFSLKCAFLGSTTTSSTKLVETSVSTSADSVTTIKSVETAEEINVRERVAMWSSSQKKELVRNTEYHNKEGNMQVQGQQRLQSASTFTLSQSTQSVANCGTNNKGALSTSTTEFPKVSKPLLRRELTTSAIEISKSKLTKVGRTNSEGTKKIKDMAAFFEAKQF